MNHCPTQPVAQPHQPLEFGQVMRVQTELGLVRGICVCVLPVDQTNPKIRWCDRPAEGYAAGGDACDWLLYTPESATAIAAHGRPRDLGPSEFVAQAGKPPLALQYAPYVTASGDIYPGIISFVGETSPDGKYVAVAMWWFLPPVNEHPGGAHYGGWLYEVASGQVLYIPCPPPWP